MPDSEGVSSSEQRSGSDGRQGGGDHGGRPRWWPRWLPGPRLVFAILVFVALVVLVYRVRGDFETAFRHLSVSRLPWLAAAVGAEVASFLCYAEVQRELLEAGGATVHLRTMVGLAVAATGLTNLVPGGTAPASGWLVGQYRRHGIPMPLALWAVLIGGFAATFAVLLLALVGAVIAGLIGLWETIACTTILLGGSFVLGMALRRLGAVETWLERHSHVPGVGIVHRAAHHAANVMDFNTSVTGGVRVVVLSILNWGLDTVCLIAAFAVLNLHVPWRAILFAYAAAQIAGSLAPVPAGIGFVEGGMIGAFALAGAPAGNAIVATIVYRLITSWGIAGVGSVALLVVNRRRPQRARLHGRAARLRDQAGSRSETRS